MIRRKDLKKEDLLLYAVTDRTWLDGRTLEAVVRESLDGGATFIQLREKHLNDEDFISEAKALKALCEEYNVPFVINDNVDVALAVNADGVHVGQSDMEAGNVREKLGPDKIIGVSAQTVEQAVLAEERGADYLGVGAVFTTGSKDDADDVSLETLRAICEAVSIPVVAIGGINRDNVAELSGSGIAGIAVISAIYAQKDIKNAAAELKNKTYYIVEATKELTEANNINVDNMMMGGNEKADRKTTSDCGMIEKKTTIGFEKNSYGDMQSSHGSLRNNSYKPHKLHDIISAHNIKGVIFDMDGVVLDSMVIWNDLGERYLKNIGIEPEENLGEIFFNMSLKESSAYIASHYGIEKTADEIKLEFKEMLKEFYFNEVLEKTGSGDVIRYLKSRGIPCVAATASPKEHVTRALQRTGLLECFEAVLTTDEVGKGKTEPDIYLKAAEMIGSVPKNTLVFEDAVYCVETAGKAGFVTLGIYDARGERNQEKLKETAMYYVTDYSTLL